MKYTITFQVDTWKWTPNEDSVRYALKTGFGDMEIENLNFSPVIETQISLPGTAGNNIFSMFDKAKESKKYPQLRVIYDGNERKQLVFKLKGEKSNSPGCIDVSDGGPYGENLFYARITRTVNNGFHIKWYVAANEDDTAKSVILTVCNDPLTFGKVHGQKYANCMFCGLELTNKNSLTVGYGPICAEKWGLPWEGTADMEAERKLLENL